MIRIEDIIPYVENALVNNEFAQGGFIIAIMGAIWAIVKDVPNKIYSRIRRHLLYTVTIEQSDELYVYMNKWISDNYSKKLRNLEAFIKERYNTWEEESDGKEGKREENINLRNHSDYFYIYKDWRIIRIEKQREKMEAAESLSGAYLGRIIISGFKSKKAIQKILQESLKYKKKDDPNILKHYTYQANYGAWVSKKTMLLKDVDKIFFPEKELLLEKIDKFENSKELYQKRGVLWKLGILLYGKPGTGKTSFSTALCGYTKRDLYTLNLSTMNDNTFSSAFEEIPPGSLLLIDDADVRIPNRDSKEKSDVSLSTLLGALSGTMSLGDVIVVMCTNNLELFDPALLRKGRIDIIHEVKYPDKKCIIDYINNFYAPFKAPENREYKKLSIVELEELCLSEPDPINLVNKVSTFGFVPNTINEENHLIHKAVTPKGTEYFITNVSFANNE